MNTNVVVIVAAGVAVMLAISAGGPSGFEGLGGGPTDPNAVAKSNNNVNKHGRRKRKKRGNYQPQTDPEHDESFEDWLKRKGEDLSPAVPSVVDEKKPGESSDIFTDMIKDIKESTPEELLSGGVKYLAPVVGEINMASDVVKHGLEYGRSQMDLDKTDFSHGVDNVAASIHDTLEKARTAGRNDHQFEEMAKENKVPEVLGQIADGVAYVATGGLMRDVTIGTTEAAVDATAEVTGLVGDAAQDIASPEGMDALGDSAVTAAERGGYYVEHPEQFSQDLTDFSSNAQSLGLGGGGITASQAVTDIANGAASAVATVEQSSVGQAVEQAATAVAESPVGQAVETAVKVVEESPVGQVANAAANTVNNAASAVSNAYCNNGWFKPPGC